MDGIKGTAPNAGVQIIRLYPTDGGLPLYLMVGDDDVLFLLDPDHGIQVGNSDFSFTLNRVSL